MKKKGLRALTILLVLVLLSGAICLVGCSSSSGETYTCGYCGAKMKGAYWDYFGGQYACRSCSKSYRGN